MRSQLGYAWFWIGVSSLGACSLTAGDFDPVRVESAGSAGDAPSGSEGSVTPSGLEGCASSCDSASNGSATGSESNASGGSAVSPSSSALGSGETSTAALPLAGAAGATGASDGADPPGEAPLPADAGTLPEPPLPVPVTPPDESPLLGWAAVAGLGTSTTTGGAGGRTVRATTAEQLEAFAALPEPLTIELAGTLRLGRVVFASHKTLRGVGPAPRLEGGLRIRGLVDDFVQNVIIQNLQIDASFSEVNGDGVQIHYAHHVWIDHCEISDAADGNLDIVHGSDFVTVSWNRFSYTGGATGSRRSTQIGHSDEGAAEDAGHLRVTLHHNAWLDGVLGSMPSARFGDVHVFNNFYASPGSPAITAALGSRLLVESNFFENVAIPYQLEGGAGTEPQLRAVSNVFIAPTPQREEGGTAFVPPYAYVPDAALSVRELVQASAGATLSSAATP
jgi:pectate lyase